MKGIISLVELIAVGIVLFVAFLYFFVYAPTTRTLPVREKVLIFDFLFSEFGYQTNLFNATINNKISDYLSKDFGEIGKTLKHKYKLYHAHSREILIACNCSNKTLLILNNMFRDMNINGRNVTISFVGTNLENINPSDALLIWGCIKKDYTLQLLNYLIKGSGVINVCDNPFANGNPNVYSNIFKIKNCSSTRLSLLTNITKPFSGFDSSYEAKKYFFNIKVFGDFSSYKWNYAFDNVLGNNTICDENEDETKYLLKTPGSPKNLSACVINEVGDAKVVWIANFTKGFSSLDEIDNSRKNLLLSVLLVASKKNGYPREDVRMLDISAFFFDFNYVDYFEPFYFILSVS